MTVYTTSSLSASVIWPGPIEPIWQVLPGYSQNLPGRKRADLGLSERLFIGAVLNIPKERRPWGIVSQLAEMLCVSRPTLYVIGACIKAGLQAPVVLPMITAGPSLESVRLDGPKTITVTPSRMQRTALTLMFPGGVSERSAEVCLEAAFDESRSPAFLSALLHEAGTRADEILKNVDHSVLGPVMQARDELFVGREPILLMVELNSLVITGLYATNDRDAETWGCVLLFTQDRRVKIKGLAEDGCIPYGASCKAAKLDAAIQKDVWHPLEDVRKVIRDVEREAIQKLKTAERLEKQLRKHEDDAVHAKWVEFDDQFDDLVRQIDELSFWRGCLWDAVVVIRSGIIGVEFSSIWSSYGMDVTVVEMFPHLVPLEDIEVSTELEKAFKKRGIETIIGHKVESVETNVTGVRVIVSAGGESRVLEAEQAMVGSGFVRIRRDWDLRKLA